MNRMRQLVFQFMSLPYTVRRQIGVDLGVLHAGENQQDSNDLNLMIVNRISKEGDASITKFEERVRRDHEHYDNLNGSVA